MSSCIKRNDIEKNIYKCFYKCFFSGGSGVIPPMLPTILMSGNLVIVIVSKIFLYLVRDNPFVFMTILVLIALSGDNENLRRSLREAWTFFPLIIMFLWSHQSYGEHSHCWCYFKNCSTIAWFLLKIFFLSISDKSTCQI